jgi:hypothetical protein
LNETNSKIQKGSKRPTEVKVTVEVKMVENERRGMTVGRKRRGELSLFKLI